MIPRFAAKSLAKRFELLKNVAASLREVRGAKGARAVQVRRRVELNIHPGHIDVTPGSWRNRRNGTGIAQIQKV
jgi:hypothetical protein